MRLPPVFVAIWVVLVAPAFAQQGAIEKPKLTMSVGGIMSQVDRLALAVAVQKGFFKEEGLEPEMVDAGSGTKTLQTVIGGAADVGQGSYEHTVRVQPKGVDLVAFEFFGRYAGHVLVVPKKAGESINSVKDLKGKKIGISSPGSGTHIFFGRLAERAGMKLDEFSYISVGNGPGAVASLRSGQIDALVNLDPNISEMELAGEVKILADGRTAEGMKQVYGGDYLVNSMYARAEWLKQNPNTAQALANAMWRTMKWMSTASIDDVIAIMPADYKANRDAYRHSVEANYPSFLWDGIATIDAAQRVFETIAAFEPELKGEKIDFPRTFTNEFTRRAHEKYK